MINPFPWHEKEKKCNLRTFSKYLLALTFALHFNLFLSLPASLGAGTTGCSDWVPYGVGVHQITSSSSATIGFPNYPFNGVPIGSDGIQYSLSVPQGSQSTIISFDYDVITWDMVNWNSFDVYINNNNLLHIGGTTYPLYQDLGWRTFSYDLSSYAGQAVIVKIEVQNRYDNLYPTWAFIRNLSMAGCITKITVTPTDATVYLHHFDPKMKEMQFTATGNYSDGSTASLTATATWATSDASIASITGGLATGLKPGSCNITAAQEGKSASANLEVLCRKYTQYRQDVGAWKDLPYAWHIPSHPNQPQLGSEASRTAWGVLPWSIGSKGCALTSSAMAISSTGNVIDPGNLNRYMTQAPEGSFYDKGNGVIFSSTIPIFSDHKIKATDYISYSQRSWEKQLDSCNLIIARVTRPSGSDHYILIIGYQNGQFISYDPLYDGEHVVVNTIQDGILLEF